MNPANYFRSIPLRRTPVREYFKEVDTTNAPNAPVTPLVVFQTYHDKSRIPSDIYENIKKYAPDYRHVVYDDTEAIQLIRDHYPTEVLDLFHRLKGAHRGDLVRYCYLYVHGGVYMDIKTELIKPLAEIFIDPTLLYTVVSHSNDHIYQGIIAVPPRHPLLHELIQYMVDIKEPRHYFEYTNDFYNRIQSDLDGAVTQGRLHGKKYEYHLFKEMCSSDGGKCYDGLDRYQLCCFVHSEGNPIIKTRRSSYPW